MGGSNFNIQSIQQIGESSLKQIVTVFEQMYLEIFSNDMVGFANITAQGILGSLFISYGSITVVDLENNFYNMHKAWDNQQPVETFSDQIHDCVDFAEAVGVVVVEAQNLTTAYTKILAIVIFNSACRRWDGKLEADKTWDSFNVHFAVSYRQHRQIHGGKSCSLRVLNSAVEQPEEYIT